MRSLKRKPPPTCRGVQRRGRGPMAWLHGCESGPSFLFRPAIGNLTRFRNPMLGRSFWAPAERRPRSSPSIDAVSQACVGSIKFIIVFRVGPVVSRSQVARWHYIILIVPRSLAFTFTWKKCFSSTLSDQFAACRRLLREMPSPLAPVDAACSCHLRHFVNAACFQRFYFNREPQVVDPEDASGNPERKCDGQFDNLATVRLSVAVPLGNEDWVLLTGSLLYFSAVTGSLLCFTTSVAIFGHCNRKKESLFDGACALS